MPPKTIYVPDAAVPTWDEAEKLWGRSLASLVNQLVEDYVEKRRGELIKAREGVDRIVVEVGDEGRRHKEAFRGRWLVEPSPTSMENHPAGATWGVALTEKGNFAVLSEYTDATLEVYETLGEAADDGIPEDIVAMAAEAAGADYVVELDI